MTTYIDFPIETDPEATLQTVYDFIQSVFPNWSPNDGNLDTILAQAFTRVAAQVRDLASNVPADIFRWAGPNLYNVPPLDATFASVKSTWTAVDSAGYTIPADTVVEIPIAGDETAAFLVVYDVTIPPGQTSTVAGEVSLQALDAGAAGSGLGGAGTHPSLISLLSFVSTITLTGITTGGTDAESDDDYLNRLALKLQTMSPRPILPRDFEILSQDIAGVWRSVALDGYNPDTSTYGQERYITLASLDSVGNPVAPAVKANVQTYLDGMREVTFIVRTIDATVTQIDVTFQVKTLPGFVAASVQADAIAAIQALLNPALWGIDIASGADVRDWRNKTVLRYQDVQHALRSVSGVDYIEALTTRLSGGSMGTSDLTLPGAIPVAKAGVITGVAD